MPLNELLWACPACGTDRGLAPEGDAFICRACATRFHRDRGASIRAVDPAGDSVIRSAAEWVDRLPDPATLLDAAEPTGQGIRLARVTLRTVTGEGIVRGEEGYLNRFERFGEEREGSLELRLDRLIFQEEAPSPTTWTFEALRAIQTSSHTLQIRAVRQPLASIRFADDSVFLWEQLITGALRRFYRRTGRGDIAEFQPRIEVPR